MPRPKPPSSTLGAEIIVIGNEILQAHTRDTNSGWLAGALLRVGIETRWISIVPDDADAIRAALSLAEGRAPIVLITGGLGPTSDDITKATLAAYFGHDLVPNPAVLEDIRQFLHRRGRPALSDLNRAQAEVPSGCTVIRNPVGTAPGMWFERNGVVFVSMPGVPFEMEEMASTRVIPKLLETVDVPNVLQRTVLTFGVPEAELAARLSAFEASLDAHVSIAYLPSPSGVRVRLTARGGDRPSLERRLAAHTRTLDDILGADRFGYDDDTLEGVVGRWLTERRATVATAESCTGGAIARLITSVPGSSGYYLGSVIAYANRVKHARLGVSQAALEAHGAVSQEVVAQMAAGARRAIGADYAVATSGIAGPGGGTQDKPVGTTWIAAASPSQIVTERFQFGELRRINIERSAYTALNMLRKLITNTK